MGASQSFFRSRMNAQSSFITLSNLLPPPLKLSLHARRSWKWRTLVPLRSAGWRAPHPRSSHYGNRRKDQIIDYRHEDGRNDVTKHFSQPHPSTPDALESSRNKDRRKERDRRQRARDLLDGAIVFSRRD